MKKILFLVAVFAVGAVIFMHHRAAGNTQSVHDVLADAQQLIGRDINVTGVVGDSVAVLGVGGFEVKGNDGSILLVVSGSGVPLEGTQVTIRGVLRQAYASGNAQKLVLVEDSPEPANHDGVK